MVLALNIIDTIYNGNCMSFLPDMPDDCINLTLTDIPYGEVNRPDNGLRTLNRGGADVSTFNLDMFLNELFRVTKGTIIIFCGRGQMSDIAKYFQDKQDKHLGTVRQIIWEKSNPSPMNGQHIYLSGIENAIWFKKRGSVFNARCKNTVFRYPCGRSKIHPTEKNHDLLRELIEDNSCIDDIVFDPCCGSGAHLLVAKQCLRHYIGIEIDSQWYEIAKNRLEKEENICQV